MVVEVVPEESKGGEMRDVRKPGEVDQEVPIDAVSRLRKKIQLRVKSEEVVPEQDSHSDVSCGKRAYDNLEDSELLQGVDN